MAEDTEGKIEVIKETFFPQPPEADMEDIDNASYPTIDREWRPIVAQEILQAIANTCNDKAPGDNGITNRVIKLAAPIIAPALAILFNASVELGHAPEAMKTTVTCVVRKAGKTDYHNPRAYRPIALLNTIAKVLEAVMTERLHYDVEKYGQLPIMHTGGRKRVSCEHAIHMIMERIHSNLRARRVISMLLLDFSGAYDNVIHKRLIHNMRKRGVHPYIVRWIDSWLKDRKARIRMNEGLSDWFLVTAGVPQGSPLSPILYLYYNADLLEIADNEEELADTLIMGYVDDTCMLASGETTEETCDKLSKLHKKAERWAGKHASMFAPDKYKLIHFVHLSDRNRIKHRDRKLQLLLEDNTVYEIAPVKSARYLGVILDEHLQWEAHLEAVEEKVNDSIQALQAIAGSTWGPSREDMLKLFRAVIIPRMTYACSVWMPPKETKGERTKYKKFIAKLTAMQKRALCVCTGAYKNTAAEIMEKETNTMPIHLLFRRIIAGSTIRVTDSNLYRYSQTQRFRTRPNESYPAHKRQSPLAKCQEWMKEVLGVAREGGFPYLEHHEPMVKEPWFHPVRTTIRDSPELAIREHNDIIKGQGNTHLVVYTDGSGIDGRIGAAAWCSTMDWQKSAYLGTENQSNVFAAEVTGLVLASELAIRKGNSVRHVSIFTDNQSAIDTIRNPGQQSGQYIVKRALERMRILYNKGVLIDIHWIPAHVGVAGNEKVDILAKRAAGWREKPANKGSTAPVPFPIYTLQANAKRRINQALHRSWKASWGEQNTGREYKMRFGRGQEWEAIEGAYAGLQRAEASLAIQLRSGRIGFNAQLHRWKPAPSSTCECEEARETIRHVICECPLYTTLRRKYLGANYTHDSKKCLIRKKELRRVIRFILGTGRLQQYSNYTKKIIMDSA